MTDIEARVDRLESKMEAFMRSHDDKFNNFIQEMRQQNQMRANEIRDLQKRQDEERRKFDAELKSAQQRHENDMRDMNKKIDDKFDKISSQLQMMALTTILGVGAIVWVIVSAHK